MFLCGGVNVVFDSKTSTVLTELTWLSIFEMEKYEQMKLLAPKFRKTSAEPREGVRLYRALLVHRAGSSVLGHTGVRTIQD